MGPGNITLCPLCDKACKYQRLIDSCKFARLTYLFDNPATVFFAIFMSLWGIIISNKFCEIKVKILATVFLELWRRKQSVIQWEWDLQGTDQDEESRPGKIARLLAYISSFLVFRVRDKCKNV